MTEGAVIRRNGLDARATTLERCRLPVASFGVAQTLLPFYVVGAILSWRAGCRDSLAVAAGKPNANDQKLLTDCE